MQQDYREPEYKVRPTWGLAWGLLWDMLEQNKRKPVAKRNSRGW